MIPRREAILAAGAACLTPAIAQVSGPPFRTGGATHDIEVSGIRILPGQWRPHYPWEQIAWISPPWPSQEYMWLDFPEAIFTNQGLLYLSHTNPKFPSRFPDLPKIAWRQLPDGIGFERQLPNGASFGGRLIRASETRVDMELHLRNGTQEPLKDIALQTCLFLRGIKEFNDSTNTNKLVHVRSRGWITLSDAFAIKESEPAPYRVGWRRSGRAVADLPVMVTLSTQARRLVAMTWRTDTLSLVGNPVHPCMHADPWFKDLAPGESATIRGHIIFFEGDVSSFDWDKAL